MKIVDKRNILLKNIPFVLILCLLSFVSVSGAFLSSSLVSADESVVDEINVTVSVSCTMSGTGMDTHDAEMPNGTYEDEIGTTTLHAFCNDSNGFAIYATGYTGNTIGETNSNKLVGVDTNTTIETGLATSAGNPDISNWAMKLTKTQDSGDTTGTNAFIIDSAPNEANGTAAPFTSYHVIPNTYTKVAHKDSGTDMTAVTGGVKLTTTYAAYISKTQPADTYSGQVIYTLVHPADEYPLQAQPCEAGKICYHPNGSNVLGTMGLQDARAIDWSSCYDTNYMTRCYDENYYEVDINTLPRLEQLQENLTLLASNFSREGYGFAGWNDKFDYTGNFYGPNQTITTPNDIEASGLSLYAVWVKSVGSLQDSAKVAELCGTGAGSLTQASTTSPVTLASVSALTDQRDNETYAIAKLADGNCWMIENLRLKAEATRGDAKKALAQGYGVSSTYGNFIGLADAENTGFSGVYSANSLYSTDGSSNTINIGISDDTTSRMPRYNNLNTPTNEGNRPQNPNSNVFSANNTTVGMYSYGNYYTWHAAMANTIHYDSPTFTDADGKTSDNVNTSLCPSGWRLPYGEATGNGAASGGFSYLDTRLGGTGAAQTTAEASNRWRKFPNNFLYSGYFSSLFANNRGGYGGYWSSTTSSSVTSYRLDLSNSYVRPGSGYDHKSNGFAIRCVTPSL